MKTNTIFPNGFRNIMQFFPKLSY